MRWKLHERWHELAPSPTLEWERRNSYPLADRDPSQLFQRFQTSQDLCHILNDLRSISVGASFLGGLKAFFGLVRLQRIQRECGLPCLAVLCLLAAAYGGGLRKSREACQRSE